MRYDSLATVQLVSPVPSVDDAVRCKACFGRQGTFVCNRPFGLELKASAANCWPTIREYTGYAGEGVCQAADIVDDADKETGRRQASLAPDEQGRGLSGVPARMRMSTCGSRIACASVARGCRRLPGRERLAEITARWHKELPEAVNVLERGLTAQPLGPTAHHGAFCIRRTEPARSELITRLLWTGANVA